MADDSKAPAQADSHEVASLKFKRATLETKLKALAGMKPAEGHDLSDVRSRTENQIKEIDAALKGAK